MSSTVKIHAPIAGQRVVTLELPYVRGKSLRQYLKDPVAMPFGLAGRRVNSGSCFMKLDNTKVRLSYELRPGEEIILVRRAH